ncbi:MAG: hypothetical protein ACYDFT_01710 [Thermoplasmata archaeon]
MEIKHAGPRGTSLDPTTDALALLGRLASERSREDPLRPARLWEELRGLGFYFMSTGRDGRIQRIPEADGGRIALWGEFYAALLLEHAAGTGLLDGDPTTDSYWKKP